MTWPLLLLLVLAFLFGMFFQFMLSAFARIRRLQESGRVTAQHLKRLAEIKSASDAERAFHGSKRST